MSPLDDYHTNESSNTSNSTARKETSKNKNTVFIAIIAFLTIVIVGGGVYFATRTTPNKDSDAASLNSSSSSSQDVVSSSSSSAPVREIQNVSTAEGALTKEQITSSRALATELAGKTANLDIESIVTGTLTASTIAELKTELGADAPTLNVPTGKTVELTVKYSSIGDSDFQNASLYVKLSDGLTLVPGSIKDTFLTRTTDVNDSVYSTSNKLIVYGPGSANKTTSPMKIGETGTLTFRVQLDAQAASSLAVASYIKEESGKIGQPSVFFVEVTN